MRFAFSEFFFVQRFVWSAMNLDISFGTRTWLAAILNLGIIAEDVAMSLALPEGGGEGGLGHILET